MQFKDVTKWVRYSQKKAEALDLAGIPYVHFRDMLGANLSDNISETLFYLLCSDIE